MILTFRPIDKWPAGWDRSSTGKPNPFSGSYSSTLELLDRELSALKATDAFLQVDMDGSQLRLDGQPRANAKADYRGVILTIDSRTHGVLSYPCDAFQGRYHNDPEDWAINLRAIALGLEALRKVERYGIAERGQQYAGFAQIGSGGIALAGAMTVEEAAAFIAKCSEGVADPVLVAQIITDDGIRDFSFRRAAKKHHPDAGGDPETFRKLTEARDLLLKAAS
jgi:hypothetical protein